MQRYSFNIGRAVVLGLAAAIVVEAVDDDSADAEDEFGQGGVLSGDYFRGVSA
jgi:hypothetical protein